MTETLSGIETIIQSLGEFFAERQGTRVPFAFGRAALVAHENKGRASCIWVPARSAVAKPERMSRQAEGETPPFEKRERFVVVCWGASRAAAEALHNALLATLAASPVEVEVGDYEWESEAVANAAPNLRGATIAQELAILTEVPDAPPHGGVTLWTVQQVDHGCAIAHADGSEEEQHIIVEA